MTDHQSIPPPDLQADRKLQARADARKLLERRRQRLRIIRKRAIAGSVAAFAVAWAAIGFQLVTGNDPALSKTSRAAAVTSTSTAAQKKQQQATATSSSSGSASSAASTPSTSTGSSTATGSSSSTSTSSSSQQVAPVTTQQS
jgi:cytoskeletal protein RodZ